MFVIDLIYLFIFIFLFIIFIIFFLFKYTYFLHTVANLLGSVPDTGPTLLENLVTDVPQASASVCPATRPFRYRKANMFVCGIYINVDIRSSLYLLPCNFFNLLYKSKLMVMINELQVKNGRF